MLKRWMVALSIVVGLAAAFWFALPAAPAMVRQGDAARSFSLPDINGTMASLPIGEVILLNFWATWCPPCREEIPSLSALHRKFASRGLKVVAVSVDKNHDDLTGFVHENQMPFEVLNDVDSHVSHQYGVYRYPESFLIDRNGTVRYHLIGAVDWMSAPVLQTVEGMLNEPRNGGAAD
ncbi:MAG TPA: TlpA disulfide reductase family protein [Mariprofundaceae bacterium]|nr:TlpA disulfide reductase family protein [Mariprofundaceae bacterium]